MAALVIKKLMGLATISANFIFKPWAPISINPKLSSMVEAKFAIEKFPVIASSILVFCFNAPTDTLLEFWNISSKWSFITFNCSINKLELLTVLPDICDNPSDNFENPDDCTLTKLNVDVATELTILLISLLLIPLFIVLLLL